MAGEPTRTGPGGVEITNQTPSPDAWGMVVRVVEEGGDQAVLHNGSEQPVTNAAAVLVLAANTDRITAVIQNTGTANIRVGTTGVTATTGLRLVPNQVVIYDEPDVATNEIWAIAETADSIVFGQEVLPT